LRYRTKQAATVPAGRSDLEKYLKSNPAALKECALALEGKSLCDIVLPFCDDDAAGKILPDSSDVEDVSWNVPTAQVVTACYVLGTP
jgi:aminobenzoyl-glutamate utilization protein B